ncbi:kelch repeat-containing protein [Pseudoduganella sp. S-14]|uniref:kelch repeat-containing protein n=1 Tax=Pseudoduganella sp. S-14 TaxID=3404065 RepID=UPI003CE6BC2E
MYPTPLRQLAAAALLACATLSAQAQVSTGSMTVPRMLHQASALPDGRILLTGGVSTPGAPIYASTEIYDPVTGQFTPAAPMLTARREHASVTLQDGRILVAGGMTPAGAYTNTAEIYDPATGQWTAAGNMNSMRFRTIARLLPDGRVMVMGKDGYSTGGYADIFNPATGTFSKTGNFVENSGWHGLVVLADGRVMKVGGEASTAPAPYAPYSTRAEIWDPATNLWSATGPMSIGRSTIEPVLLADGKVLVAGGRNTMSQRSTEIYDPATGVFTPGAEMPADFEPQTATVLPNADIVYTAGYNRQLMRYNAASGSWNLSGPQRIRKRDLSVSRLPDGNVLLAGGAEQNDSTAYAAIWDQACSSQLTTVPVRTQNVGGDAGTVSFTVNAAPGCRFEAANLPDWLSVDGANPQQMPSGGSFAMTFKSTTNLSGTSRTASFLLGNETVTVTQVASASCPSAPVVSPTTTTVSGSGGTGSLSVFAAASCPWNVASMPSFVTATGATSGSGNGSIAYSVAANPDTTASRSGSGQVTSMGYATTFTFTQDARKLCPTPPVISLSNASFAAAGGSTTGTITAAATCKWALAVPVTWVSVTSGSSGTGNGSFSLNIAPNTGAARSDYMSASTPDGVGIAKLSQAGSACATWSVTPANTSFPATGTSGNFTVAAPASCNWSLSGVPSWMSITSAISGSGNGSIAYSVSANAGAARSATATLSGGGLTLPLSLNQQASTQPTVCSKGIVSGEPAYGNLQSSTCPAGARGTGYYTDRYTFGVLPGRVVTITLSSSSFDTYLYLRDGAGNIISSDDDSGGGTNSRISYTLPAGAWGNYTIEATSYYSGRSGAYTLNFTQ